MLSQCTSEDSFFPCNLFILIQTCKLSCETMCRNCLTYSCPWEICSWFLFSLSWIWKYLSSHEYDELLCEVTAFGEECWPELSKNKRCELLGDTNLLWKDWQCLCSYLYFFSYLFPSLKNKQTKDVNRKHGKIHQRMPEQCSKQWLEQRPPWWTLGQACKSIQWMFRVAYEPLGPFPPSHLCVIIF